MARFWVVWLAVAAAGVVWSAPGAVEVALYLDEMMVADSSLSGDQAAYVEQSYRSYQRFDRSMTRLRRFEASGGKEFDRALRTYLMRRETYLYTLREIRAGGPGQYGALKVKLDADLAAVQLAYETARDLFN